MTTPTGRAKLVRVAGDAYALHSILFPHSGATLVNPADHHFTFDLGRPVRQRENEGSVAHEEGRMLWLFAQELGGPVLEVGSDLGISTRYICEGLADGTKVYAVDCHHKWVDDPMTYPNRIQVNSDSRFYRTPEPVKWAFIDGDHRFRGVLQDIEAATASGARLLVFHDTRPGQPKPTNTSNGSEAREAVLEVFGDIEGVTIWDWASPCGVMIVKLPG